jgi:cell division cycle 2-like protein
MVMEYADHDLKAVMDKRMHQPFTISEVKCLMHQLLSGIAYLHGNWVIHRDLKTSNILYTNKGQLKICDFGLARQYGEPLKPYTQLVVTLWYRSPELLLGAKTYSTAVDVWSCGCIMAELLAKRPLFIGTNEISQLDAIFRVLGCPTSETWPGIENLENFKKFNFKGSRSVRSSLRSHFPAPGASAYEEKPTISNSGFDLLQGLLELCPEKRISAQEALDHPWFREHPLPKDPAMMPTFPGTNESLHGHRH